MKFSKLATAAMLLLAPFLAHAAAVTYNFTAKATFLFDVPFIGSDEIISGTFTYDDATPPSVFGATADYNLAVTSVTVSGANFEVMGSLPGGGSNITIMNEPRGLPNDSFSLSSDITGTSPNGNPFKPSTFLLFLDETSTVLDPFDSLSLSSVDLFLSEFETKTVQVNFFEPTPPPGVGNVATANFELLTLNQVPLPAAAWLFGSSLLGLAGIRRKK